jgi:hypothetical protein
LDSITTNRPVLIYDDKCSSCTVFAKYAFKYSRGQINCIGHYSKEGQKLRKFIFPPNYNETQMFWIITANHAYGGRSGLLPLLGLIIRSILKGNKFASGDFAAYCSDTQMCSDKKFQIKRIYNLLRRGKKLNIKFTKAIND